jgi:lysophospholipase L1-like esterase
MYRVVGVLATVLIATAATAAAATPSATPSSGTQPLTSIVQLGDSVASGEGTLYGYTYDRTAREWTGGNVDVAWPGPYPACHDSPDAYGNVVAATFGASFTQFACTGAMFRSGIAGPEIDEGVTLRPAQFGDWDRQTDLNAEYDAAKPDLVLVTLGADDVHFVKIVESCLESALKRFLHLGLECTAKHPGSTIQSDYVQTLPTLTKQYETMVQWIEARARANGVPAPKVVFTNYVNPLPSDGRTCPDTKWLYPKQVRYLSSLVDRLNQLVADTIDGLHDPNVTVADIAPAYSSKGISHIWCTPDPWAYGLSIYQLTDFDSFKSQAPFHPTPRGQRSIAAQVIPVVKTYFAAR